MSVVDDGFYVVFVSYVKEPWSCKQRESGISRRTDRHSMYGGPALDDD